MAGSAISTPTFQAVNANIANDGSADSPRGYAISTDSNITMTIANTRVLVTAVTASRTVTLPTTSVKAGMVVEVQTACTSPYTIAINSSGANLIDTLKGTKGSIKLMALVNTPTAAADWRVMEVYDEGSWTPVFSASVGTPTTVGVTSTAFTRIGRNITCLMDFTVADKGSATTVMYSTIPFTNAGNSFCGACREDTVVGILGAAYKALNDNTKVSFLKYDNTTFWVNGYRILAGFSYVI